MTAAPPVPDKSPGKARSRKAAAKKLGSRPPNDLSFFSTDAAGIDSIADEAAEILRYDRLVRKVTLQAIAIVILSLVVLVAAPFTRPVYQFFALNDKHQRLPLVPLLMPNMTNHAILSWSTTSITEIMTIGFGDFEQRLLTQKPRFTSEGWDAFVKAFIKQKIGESFKQNQLVLTTVPSNTPVIVAQGVNANHVYQWRVQLPVIMTYATNNNITRHDREIIDLTIVRVDPEKYPAGIAIDTWSLKK